MNEKLKVRKGYLKIHVAANVKSQKILSMKVTNEHVHDGSVPELVEDIAKSNEKITDKLFSDGSYNSNDIFKCLVDSCIYPCIKAKKNVRVRPKTSHILRNPSVIAQRNDLKRWKDSASYGHRWTVETVFSSIKRMFVEYVYSAKFENMVKEMMSKASLHNKFVSF